MKAITLILLGLILLGICSITSSIPGILNQLKEIKPQFQEEFVSAQTVKLKGELYVCGTVLENRDKESLYCRGFTDGYSWAVNQLKIDEQLSQ